jgi:hypothetical protein
VFFPEEAYAVAMKRVGGAGAVMLAVTLCLVGCATTPKAARSENDAAVASHQVVRRSEPPSNAQKLLSEAQLPPSARIVSTAPSTALTSGTGSEGCDGSSSASRYWLVPSTSISDAAAWVFANPASDVTSGARGQSSTDAGVITERSVTQWAVVGGRHAQLDFLFVPVDTDSVGIRVDVHVAGSVACSSTGVALYGPQ